MARKKLPFKSSSFVRLRHPTDKSVTPNEPLDNTDDGSTCSYKVFNPAKDESLSAAEASSQTTLSVTNAGVFEIGDIVEVDLDDGTVHDAGAVTAVDAVLGTILVTTGLASGAAAGKRVRVRLGAAVTMTEYGTPKLGTVDWGFRGVFANDHAAQILDLEIDIEITFIGFVGGGLDLLKVICAVIKPVDECVACE